jgi:hypothetical protein
VLGAWLQALLQHLDLSEGGNRYGAWLVSSWTDHLKLDPETPSLQKPHIITKLPVKTLTKFIDVRQSGFAYRHFTSNSPQTNRVYPLPGSNDYKSKPNGSSSFLLGRGAQLQYLLQPNTSNANKSTSSWSDNWPTFHQSLNPILPNMCDIRLVNHWVNMSSSDQTSSHPTAGILVEPQKCKNLKVRGLMNNG